MVSKNFNKHYNTSSQWNHCEFGEQEFIIQ